LGRDEARLAETRDLLGDAEHRILALDLTDHGALTAEIVKVQGRRSSHGLSAPALSHRRCQNTTVDVTSPARCQLLRASSSAPIYRRDG
jgi:hypothetical protein